MRSRTAGWTSRGAGHRREARLLGRSESGRCGYGWHEGTAGERWVVLPTEDDDQEIDQVAVGERGVDEDDLDGLAERAELLDTGMASIDGASELRRAHLADADLGANRVLLAEGPIDLSMVWSTYEGVLRGGPALQWGSRAPELCSGPPRVGRG